MYRVKYMGEVSYPYRVERRKKKWHFWSNVNSHQSLRMAEDWIKEDIVGKRPQKYAIVFSYSSEDLVADKLKGTAGKTRSPGSN